VKFETIVLENQNDICILTINRPQALNALNSQVLNEISLALDELAQKSFAQLKCLLITGQGEKAFIAGADIKEMKDLTEAQGKSFAEKGQALFRRFENLQVPVIAAVNGFALGGGLELALACDFIYASENAKLGLPEVTLGLMPGFGGTVRLARAVGLSRAKEMIFTGELLTAAEALRLRLVSRVLPLAELLPSAMKTAEAIASRGPIAVQQAKKSLQKTYDQEIDQALQTEAQEFSQLFKTTDFREGTSAFVEKRKAQFKGL
jgi:enoyl-CoA hydratase